MSRGVPSPSYGLAENCVGLCFPPFGRGPQIDRIRRETLARRGYAEPAGPDDPDAIEVVACGHPIENNEVRIVDDAGRELGERQEGMLEFRGPSVTKGYFRNDAKTPRAVPRRLDQERRPRLHRGRRHPHHRARQGHHHPRRPQHLSARDRGSDRRRSPASARAASRRSARPIRRTAPSG